MKIKKTTIKDCLKLELNQFKDFRGSFVKLFSENWFKKIKIKQINFCNFKKKNILRGFHYQIKPYQEIKIVFCIKGKCKIHILDLRKSLMTRNYVYNEKTFKKYRITDLSIKKKNTTTKFIYRENNKIFTDKIGYPQFYTQLVFELENSNIMIKTVINEEVGISLMSECKKIERFEKES